MKNNHFIYLTCFLFTLFFISSAFSIHLTDKYKIEGVYTGIAEVKGKKKFIKVYLHQRDYKHPSMQQLWNTETKETVIPKPVLGRIEEYKSKKGKGTPKVIYFSGVAAEMSKSIKVYNLNSQTVQEDGSMIGEGSVRSFFIDLTERSNSVNLEGWQYKGIYQYEQRSVPVEDFSPFLNHLLDVEAGSRRNKRLYFGYNRNTRLSADDYLGIRKEINVIFESKNSGYGFTDPNLKWLNSVEAEIKKMLQNEANEIFIYTPALDRLNVYFPGANDTYVFEPEKLMFLVDISKDERGFHFKIHLSERGKAFEGEAVAANRLENQKERERRLTQSHRDRKSYAQVLSLVGKDNIQTKPLDVSGLSNASFIKHLYEGKSRYLMYGGDKGYSDNPGNRFFFLQRNSQVLFAFLYAYSEVCASKVSRRFQKYQTTYDKVTYQGYFEKEREEGGTNTYFVRPLYLNDFKAIESQVATNGAYLAVYGDVGRTLGSFYQDFRRLIQREGCNAATLKQIEVNLYLLYKQTDPVQVLLNLE